MTDHQTETGESTPAFGASVTAPHRPQPLRGSATGDEAFPHYEEATHSFVGESHATFEGERATAEWSESEADRRSTRGTTGQHASTFIVGEDE